MTWRRPTSSWRSGRHSARLRRKKRRRLGKNDGLYLREMVRTNELLNEKCLNYINGGLQLGIHLYINVQMNNFQKAILITAGYLFEDHHLPNCFSESLCSMYGICISIYPSITPNWGYTPYMEHLAQRCSTSNRLFGSQPHIICPPAEGSHVKPGLWNTRLFLSRGLI